MSSNKLIFAMVGILVIMIFGMLTASWRVVMYPYLFIIGISMLLGLTKAMRVNPSIALMPIAVTAVYTILFVALDYTMLNVPLEAEGYILGLIPSTAIMLLGIWPMSLVVSVLYAWSFEKDKFVGKYTEQVKSAKIT